MNEPRRSSARPAGGEPGASSDAPEVWRVDAEDPDAATIDRAARLLLAGGLVAFPTETVYGLGANALDEAAVQRIFEAKGRPATDPLIVHVLEPDDLDAVAAHVPEVARRLAGAWWPGPLTLIVPRGSAIGDRVTAGLDTVAVRAPDHPVARALIEAAGVPIAAPSANPFGRTSPTRAEHVIADLGPRVDIVLDGGPCRIGVESTVVDCRSNPPRVLRPGGLTLEALRSVIPDIVGPSDSVGAADETARPQHRRSAARGDRRTPHRADPDAREGSSGEASRSPGQMMRHYAPDARMVLVAGPAGLLRAAIRLAARRLTTDGRRVGLLLGDEDRAAIPATFDAGQPADPDADSSLPVAPEGADRHLVAWLGSLDHPEQMAHRVFEALRSLDAGGAEVIIARDPGTRGLALAVRDRLVRAAEGRQVTAGAGGARRAADAIVRMMDSEMTVDPSSGDR